MNDQQDRKSFWQAYRSLVRESLFEKFPAVLIDISKAVISLVSGVIAAFFFPADDLLIKVFAGLIVFLIGSFLLSALHILLTTIGVPRKLYDQREQEIKDLAAKLASETNVLAENQRLKAQVAEMQPLYVVKTILLNQAAEAKDADGQEWIETTAVMVESLVRPSAAALFNRGRVGLGISPVATLKRASDSLKILAGRLTAEDLA